MEGNVGKSSLDRVDLQVRKETQREGREGSGRQTCVGPREGAFLLDGRLPFGVMRTE